MFRIVCYLLILTFLLSGITFARYVSTTNPNPKVVVSPFACSIVVEQGDSSFVFNNANYMHENLVMNTPQVVSFKVRNYTEGTSGSKTVAGVDVTYSLVFYVPAVFAKSAAVQITQDGSAVTPLYVLNQFLGGSKFTTESGYGEIGSLNQTFNYEGNGIFTASDGSVQVEQVSLESTVVRSFPCFSASGNMLAHLYLTRTEAVSYYKFTISHSSFSKLPGGTEKSVSYELHLVPTKGMSETNAKLDSDFGKKWTDDFGAGTAESWSVKAKDWSVAVENGSVTMTFNGTTYENVTVNTCDGKTYPCRLNALFVQASATPSVTSGN